MYAHTYTYICAHTYICMHKYIHAYLYILYIHIHTYIYRVSQRLPTFEASIRTSWAKSICGFSSAVSWIANDGSRWPSQNIVATLLRKERGEDPLEVKAKVLHHAPSRYYSRTPTYYSRIF
jgi:hypothetical protein